MRYFMTFSYDGTNYNGYQKQKNVKSIQGELEKALAKINSNTFVSIVATGRTDAKVHAINQKAHFDLDKEIASSKIKDSLNKMLPDDIYIKNVEVVSKNFHARFDAKAKEYIYKINMGEYNPIEKNYVYQYNKKLDIVEMERALKYLEGTHNFKSFTKNDDQRENYVRTIVQTSILRDNKDMNKIIISITGTGFLRYMVRNIVGVLIAVGEGRIKSSDIFDIVKAEDRSKAFKTAPPNGLYLKDIFY